MKRAFDIGGWTLTEMMMIAAIVGLVAILGNAILGRAFTHNVKSSRRITARNEVRRAMEEMTGDIEELTWIEVSSAAVIQFRLDSDHMPPDQRKPGMGPSEDFNGDGLENRRDPDVDGDMGKLVPGGEMHKVGYNMIDDDDDGDGKIDLSRRYYVEGGSLYRDTNYNEAGWGQHVSLVLSNVGPNGFVISYAGSFQDLAARGVDLGNDGLPGTSDEGEGDRIISEREIDWVLPAAGGGGNRSGSIDQDTERNLIRFITLSLSQDVNGDGENDGALSTTVEPFLLPVIRRFR